MNNIDKLERDLKGLRHDFDPGFEDKVMHRINTDQMRIRKLNSWSMGMVGLAAASIVLVLLVTYLQYGSLNPESLLGLEGFSTVEITESYDTYTTIYNE